MPALGFEYMGALEFEYIAGFAERVGVADVVFWRPSTPGVRYINPSGVHILTRCSLPGPKTKGRTASIREGEAGKRRIASNFKVQSR